MPKNNNLFFSVFKQIKSLLTLHDEGFFQSLRGALKKKNVTKSGKSPQFS